MTGKQLEDKILNRITGQREIAKLFAELVKGFEKKFSGFNPISNSFNIKDYFGIGMGQVKAMEKLIADDKIKSDWLREYTAKDGSKRLDFKGLYIFVNDTTPFYVGISKAVIGRLLQHTKGHSHNIASLAYAIGLIRYEFLYGKKHKGGRKELNFKQDVKPVKKFLLNQKIALLNIENDEELYLCEVFFAMKFKIHLNTFETH